ncbi:MSCRAMM family adhesin SdrC [Edaphobacter flagellatus]|uniref:MSCRAMM family adhesin SdrC n=1 Tax=Edaphobacter flagellatus TaxID=1933044 RepID=UPI0021B2ED26|nr:MSCRAMM family adhesin SdrC [Edaphobacter flagellatus]
MAKRVITIVLLLVLALFVYVGYNSYDAKHGGISGEVYSNGVRQTAASRAQQQASQSSDADTIVYPAQQDASTAQNTAAVQPAQTTTAAQANSLAQTTAAAPQANSQVTQSQQAAGANAPATDTISPNPPNGMVFAGSGRYQLYRQGNITWRLDTETGRSCVIFATDEEWRKPRVYRAGCGKS